MTTDSALHCDEFMPLSLIPLEKPNHDPGEHQVIDDETAYIFKLICSRERAERIVATLNAAYEHSRRTPVMTHCSPGSAADALLKFFKWAMREGPFSGCDIDGASLQDKAESLGLLIATKYDPNKHGVHPDFEGGEDYYEFSPSLAGGTVAQGAPEAPGYKSGLTYGDGYKRGFDDARGAPQAAEERRCQKCGRETKGEEALVDGKILCHPCADDVPQASTDKTLAQALYEAECYGIGATSDTNQRVILQAAKELAALRARPQAARTYSGQQISIAVEKVISEMLERGKLIRGHAVPQGAALPTKSAMETALRYMRTTAEYNQKNAARVSGASEGAEIYGDAAKCIEYVIALSRPE